MGQGWGGLWMVLVCYARWQKKKKKKQLLTLMLCYLWNRVLVAASCKPFPTQQRLVAPDILKSSKAHHELFLSV